MDYFFLSVAGFCAGILLRSFIPFSWPTICFIGLLAALAYFLYKLQRARTYVFVCVFFAASCIGAARVALAPQELPQPFASRIETEVTFTGKVAGDPDTRDTNQHIPIRVIEEGEETTILAFAPLYPTFSYGETVSVSGTLERPEPFATDGGRTFRYDQFLAKDDIFATIPKAHVSSVEPAGGIARVIGTLFNAKHAFARGIRAALPEPSSALAEGLLTGGKQGLGKELLEAFTVSGLVQIVVLSGYNVMIVAEAILKIFSFLPLRYAYGSAGVGILLFVIAAGSGSAALRAGLMACIALYARATGRTYDALRGLFAALILLCLWNPLYLAFDPGFELSFIATLGLIVGTPLVASQLPFTNATLKELAATTIAAQVAVLPLLLYQTGKLSLVSVFANILVTPFIPIAMALSCIAGVAGMIFAAAAPLFGLPAHLVLSYIIGVGRYAAELPLAQVSLPVFPFVIVLALYGVLFLLTRQSPLPFSPRTRSS